MPLYHPIKIGSLELPGNLFLAPVAGYTDRVFRSICAEYGADFSFTELVSAEALMRGSRPSLDLVRRGENEKRYAIQLFGHDPVTMYRATMAISAFRPEAVDINAGCPVPKVVKTGAGSALMKEPTLLGRIVEAVVRASGEMLDSAPVTVKMRSGWDSQHVNYLECARIAAEAGAAMVTLHPRTKGQGYGGKSDWSQIAELASRLSIPVTGSGDLYTPEDAGRMLRETGCAAIMFARGAEGNPFIFPAARSFLTTSSWEPPAFAERIEVALRHLTLLADDIGERAACMEMRKQFCSYTKGFPGKTGESGSAALRKRLTAAESIADYRVILKNFTTENTEFGCP
ncbi:MAG: tRNA dihydrouridine synthase DusB [Treponema sp.]|nr:tRNA dihydrouridine synthase DusB [Treponema sp.]